MRILFTSLFVLINCSLSVGQQMYFQSAFGDTALDDGKAVIKTSTGEYCMVGSTGSNTSGLSDVAIYFIDTLGQLIGNYSYRIGLPGDEFPIDVVETPDGGFIVTGYTYSSPLDTVYSDIFALKIDGIFGNLVWAKVYGGDAGDDMALSIDRTPDNNYIIAGGTTSFGPVGESALILKINENGDPMWSATCNISGVNFFNDCKITSDAQYIFAGGTLAGSVVDHFIVKMDSLGNMLWSKRYGTNGTEYLNSIFPTSDNGFIAAGVCTESTAGNTDRNVIKLDSAGNLLWTYNYGTPEDDDARSIIEDLNNNYIVCGITNVDHLGGIINQLSLDKIDASGNFIWSNSYGDTTETCEGYNLVSGFNNGYIASGFSVSFGEPNGDAFLVKTDDNGFTDCNSFPLVSVKNAVTFQDSTGANSQLFAINSTSIALPLQNFINQYAQNCFFDNINTLSKIQYVKIFPNPSTNFIQVETEFENNLITIFDQFGRRLFSRRENTYKSNIDISTFSPGIYLLEVKSGKNIARNKFIKE